MNAAASLAVAALGILIGILAASWFGWPAVVVLFLLVVIVVATVSTRLQ